MKVLITGATGLVGSEIVKHCMSQNIPVNYLTTSKDKVVSKPGYQGFYWNPKTEEIDTNCFDGVTAIINLAGASISKRWTFSYKETIRSSRVNSLKTLKKGLLDQNTESITAFVSASAIGIYPDSLSKYYSEDEQAVDHSFLGKVVQEWEVGVDAFKTFDFSVAKIRIGLVVSTEGGALTEMAKPIKNYVGAAFGSGEQWQSWIHISDLARIFLFALENRLNGVYNGVAPNPVTNNKLVKEIATVLDKPLFLPNIPQFVMKTILGEMAYILFVSQRVSSKKIEEEGFTFAHPNICVALRDLYAKEESSASSRASSSNEYISLS